VTSEQHASEANDAPRLKALEDESRQLKQTVALVAVLNLLVAMHFIRPGGGSAVASTDLRGWVLP
jgi:hypothetical protein